VASENQRWMGRCNWKGAGQTGGGKQKNQQRTGNDIDAFTDRRGSSSCVNQRKAWTQETEGGKKGSARAVPEERKAKKRRSRPLTRE